jgi:hypothetical protein
VSNERFDAMLATLKKAGAALRDAEIPFAVGGGFAVWARGGTASDHDVDLLVKQDDAEQALTVLERLGFRGERPPEGWLLKAWDGDVLVDLIFEPTGATVTDELLAACTDEPFEAEMLPVLPLDEVLVSRLLALTEHALDYEGLLETARLVREQLDWEAVRARTAGSPFARAFFTMAEGLGVVPHGPAGGGDAGAGPPPD